MNVEFLLMSAKTMFDKAEKEARANLSSAAQAYKAAAKQYRLAANALPNRKDELEALASECDAKANGSYENNNKNNIVKSGTVNNVNTNSQCNTQVQTIQRAQQAAEEELLTEEEAIAKLNALIGLRGVKTKVKKLVSLVKFNKQRQDEGSPIPEGFSNHLVFTGNPGTGKTTVARLMGQIYRSLGLLENGRVVETGRNNLVAGYVGQTAIKTQEKIDEALGGILFVDEAYTLNSGGGNDFGKEAMDTLLKAMEDHRDELVVIIAGYSAPMNELLKTNEGLSSRFNTVIEFEDYNPDELYRIFIGQVSKNALKMDPEADNAVKKEIQGLYDKRDEHFGNARTIRNAFQKTYENHAMRVIEMQNYTQNDMCTITIEDLPNFKEIK